MTQQAGSAGSEPTAPRQRPEAIRAVPVRHPGRWVTGAVLLLLVAMIVHTLVSRVPNPTGAKGEVWRFSWNEVGSYLFSPSIFPAAELTIWLTILAMGVGIVGGVIIGTMRLSANPLLKGIAFLYAWFFRGTPVLVQIFFWYNIASVYSSPVSIGIPFGHAFWFADPNKVITGFIAVSVLGLGLNEAAYMSEIVRAGLLSVDAGQIEAAQSLGMRRLLTLRRVVLPQAMRVIIPPTGNEVISMLKTTSLAGLAGMIELYGWSQAVATRTFQPIPPLITISLWYLFMTTVLSIGQYFVERHYRRGVAGQSPGTFTELWAMSIGRWGRADYAVAAAPATVEGRG